MSDSESTVRIQINSIYKYRSHIPHTKPSIYSPCTVLDVFDISGSDKVHLLGFNDPKVEFLLDVRDFVESFEQDHAMEACRRFKQELREILSDD